MGLGTIEIWEFWRAAANGRASTNHGWYRMRAKRFIIIIIINEWAFACACASDAYCVRESARACAWRRRPCPIVWACVRRVGRGQTGARSPANSVSHFLFSPLSPLRLYTPQPSRHVTSCSTNDRFPLFLSVSSVTDSTPPPTTTTATRRSRRSSRRAWTTCIQYGNNNQYDVQAPHSKSVGRGG